MRFYPPGTRIAGRYEIAGRPLMGGMGIVYLCNDLEEDRPVALKTFRPEYLPDRAARDRFLREGTAWMDLGAHPHVVRCYQVFQPGVSPEVYLVLELVAKEQGREDASLRSWLTLRPGSGQAPGVPLPVEQALLFALQIARGMAHATATIPGFVHRDLKPENVLVGADKLSSVDINRLRVTDFGLAAVLQEAGSKMLAVEEGVQVDKGKPGRTQLTQGIVGTPLYMAPEQWKGQEVTVQTDVYALGCILYEMVAGQRAVGGSSLAALRRAHCRGEVRPLPQDLSAAVGEVMARCLALEAGERYGSWEAVEAALVTAYEEVAGPAPAAELVAALSRAERVAAGWSYNAIGISYEELGKAKVALGYFERARNIAQAEGERRLEAAGLSNLGLAYVALDDAQRAIGFYEQALAIAREIGDRFGECIALGNLACTLEDAQQAIGFHKQSLALAREVGYRRREGTELGYLGQAYAKLGDLQRAIEYDRRSLTVFREIGDQRGEEAALGSLGSDFESLGDIQRAIEFFKQELAIARQIGYRLGEGTALRNLGSAYRSLGNATQAIVFYEQALAVAREIGDQRGERAILNSLGLVYAALGDARRAIGLHEQALEMAREIGDRYEEGNVIGNLGIAYRDLLGDAQRAACFFKQQLAITREISDRRGEQNALDDLGVVYLTLGEMRQAVEFLKQALALAREIGDQRRQGYVLTHLGTAYVQLHEARQAIGFLEQANLINHEVGDRRLEGSIMANLGEAYGHLGDAQRAMQCYKQASAIMAETGDVRNAAGIDFKLTGLLVQQGRFAEALFHAEQAARVFTQIGHAGYAQRAQQLVAQIRAALRSGGPSPAQILQQFAPVIEAVVAAARGHRQARAAVEAAFGQLEQGNWRIVEPIQRIWAGERDETTLTAGIDLNSALIVRQILKQLGD